MAMSAARWPPRSEAMAAIVRAFWAWTALKPAMGPDVAQTGRRLESGPARDTSSTTAPSRASTGARATAVNLASVTSRQPRRGGSIRRGSRLSVFRGTVGRSREWEDA